MPERRIHSCVSADIVWLKPNYSSVPLCCAQAFGESALTAARRSYEADEPRGCSRSFDLMKLPAAVDMEPPTKAVRDLAKLPFGGFAKCGPVALVRWMIAKLEPIEFVTQDWPRNGAARCAGCVNDLEESRPQGRAAGRIDKCVLAPFLRLAQCL